MRKMVILLAVVMRRVPQSCLRLSPPSILLRSSEGASCHSPDTGGDGSPSRPRRVQRRNSSCTGSSSRRSVRPLNTDGDAAARHPYPIPTPGPVSVALSSKNKPPEPQRAQSAKTGRADKICSRTDAPEPRPEKRTAGHHTITNQVIRAERARARFGRRFGDDERFARRLPKLLQPANRERRREPEEIVRPKQRHRKKSEEHEGHQHKRTAPIFVGQVRDRNVAEHGAAHFDGDKVAELLRVQSAVIHRP